MVTSYFLYLSILQSIYLSIFLPSVNLVERDTCPNGYQLLDPDASGKRTQMDLGNFGSSQKKEKNKKYSNTIFKNDNESISKCGTGSGTIEKYSTNK